MNQIPPKPTTNPVIGNIVSHLDPPINKNNNPTPIKAILYTYLFFDINSANSFFLPQAS